MDVLVGTSLEEDTKKEIIIKINNPNYKGGMGHLIEEHYFGLKINNNQEPDFPKAGVELKVTAYEIGKKGGYSAGERLVVTMISYKDAIEKDFYNSHVFNKTKSILLVHYLRNRSLTRMEYPINFVTLFSPPEEDLKIIQQDYEKIITKVKQGKAHELSEGETMYLGASTKGATSDKSNVPQFFYAPDLKARKRSFCFKKSYMTYILNKYILGKIDTHESILSSVKEIEEKTFEDLIEEKINKHIGKTDIQLMTELDAKLKPSAKNFWSSLSYRMLGIKSNRAEEFEKANIEIKAIRLEEDGDMKESISFPHICLKKFAYEEWEDSDFNENLSSKRYLFVVFKKQNDKYNLKGCQLWNVSNEDLEEARIGWENIKKILRQGIILQKKYGKNGTDFRVFNNFPKVKDNRVIHIRPHTSKRYYKLGDGEIIGDSISYGDELPDGRFITKQCFWLNNSYILSQLNENLKN